MHLALPCVFLFLVHNLASFTIFMKKATNASISTSSDLVYDAALVFWRTVTNIFFREVRPRGAFNIPRDGPVIFVAAPHHNQACQLS